MYKNHIVSILQSNGASESNYYIQRYEQFEKMQVSRHKMRVAAQSLYQHVALPLYLVQARQSRW